MHGHWRSYSMIRDTQDGIKGLRCSRCAYWTPLIQRSADEQARLVVTPPAHERCVAVVKTVVQKLKRVG